MIAFRNWLSNLDQGGQFYRLFEHIPDLMFFVKDKESRLVMGNHRFLEHCGFATNKDLAGKSDQDIFPDYMSEKFRRDDQTVIELQKPLLDPYKRSFARMVCNPQIPAFSQKRRR